MAIAYLSPVTYLKPLLLHSCITCLIAWQMLCILLPIHLCRKICFVMSSSPSYLMDEIKAMDFVTHLRVSQVF